MPTDALDQFAVPGDNPRLRSSKEFIAAESDNVRAGFEAVVNQRLGGCRMA